MKRFFGSVKSKKRQSPSDGDFLPSPAGGYQLRQKDLGGLHRAAAFGDLAQVQKGLKKHRIDQRDEAQRTALHLACANGHVDVVKYLVDNKCKINLVDNDKRSPLMKAVQCQQEECVAVLLEHGASVNLPDADGNTALHLAVLCANARVAGLLLECEADIDPQNKEGCTPLFLAVSRNHEETVKLLLRKGANVDARDQCGRTPLMTAAAAGELDLVKVLIRYGADVCHKDTKGWTAEDHATTNGYSSVSKHLVKYGKSDNTGEAFAGVRSALRWAEDASFMCGLPAVDRGAIDVSSQEDSISSEAAGSEDTWPTSEEELDFAPKKVEKPNLVQLLNAHLQSRKTSSEMTNEQTRTSQPLKGDEDSEAQVGADGNDCEEVKEKPEKLCSDGREEDLRDAFHSRTEEECRDQEDEEKDRQSEDTVDGHQVHSVSKDTAGAVLVVGAEEKEAESSPWDSESESGSLLGEPSEVLHPGIEGCGACSPPGPEECGNDESSEWSCHMLSLTESEGVKDAIKNYAEECRDQEDEEKDRQSEDTVDGHQVHSVSKDTADESSEWSCHMSSSTEREGVKDAIENYEVGKEKSKQDCDVVTEQEDSDGLNTAPGNVPAPQMEHSLTVKKKDRLKMEAEKAIEETANKNFSSEGRSEFMNMWMRSCTLEEEKEKRMRVEALYEQTKETLRRKEDEYSKEMEKKEQLELHSRNLETELLTLKKLLKQVEEERDEKQRWLSEEKSARALQQEMYRQKELEDVRRALLLENAERKWESERKKVKKLEELNHLVEERLEQEKKRNTEVQQDCSRLKKLLDRAGKKLQLLRTKETELSQRLEMESDKCARLAAENERLREELAVVRGSNEKLQKRKCQLKEEVATLKQRLEAGVADASQMELYRREVEERAGQELAEKLQQVNVFLQVHAASQDRIEQIRADHHASLSNQLEQRIGDLEYELEKIRNTEQDLLFQKESTRAEVESYRRLYVEEAQVRSSLAQKLERAEEKLAEANAKLLQERRRNQSSLISSAASGGLTAGPVWYASDLGQLGNGRLLNRNLCLPPTSTALTSTSSVKAYVAKVRQELEEKITKVLEEATAAIQS